MRELARELDLSLATVSLALRDDPRIQASTTARVKALALARGYHADPVVAEGLSRARRRNFYRETLVWLLDRPPEEQPWITTLFAAAAERGRMLGYQVEYVRVDFSNAAGLRRLARTWRARGIRGALVGPLGQAVADPGLPWADFSWVAIGQSLISPALHRVGRDYDKDIDQALARLHARGCRRPGFVDDPTVNHLMRRPLLRASLEYYHEHGRMFSAPYHTVDLARPSVLARWLERNRPDSLVLGIGFNGRVDAIHRLIANLPQVELSPPLVEGLEGFVPDYASMGHSAIGLLHRSLTEGEKGVPPHEQTVVVSSGWRDGDVGVGR
ncbi:MAG: transcriptional regulator [Rariglobus sp.]|nr:transcriptional regulator [Rariglobus sp.]